MIFWDNPRIYFILLVKQFSEKHTIKALLKSVNTFNSKNSLNLRMSSVVRKGSLCHTQAVQFQISPSVQSDLRAILSVAKSI